ncbi:PREDICTED: coiled-coil domain-containing protein 42 homolog isoform X1 [Polistes dominula]|uniref:Coiled-coil domain-containing protein 42 homolog isoform X1 n=1 Tax=Polistes dominula TaxID=743375 RepID=A0ABM1IUV1_POLDO|nr:PREDICTED: coiled-coil domain-containing protein 42 homolog isoform X1 [Polistes dominula]
MATAHRKNNLDFVKRAEIPKNSLEGVKELYLSKQEAQNIKKYPEWDVPRINPAFELIKARRDLNISEQKLREKWIEQEEKRKEMDEQWNNLREQELIFRESFIKYNTFVKENQEKRQRAKRKISEERERQTKYQEDVDDLEEKLNYMKGMCEKMQKHVEIYRKYQNYLERVVNETGSFKSITDIFQRYESLIEAKASLSEDQDKNIQLLEETETNIVKSRRIRRSFEFGRTRLSSSHLVRGSTRSADGTAVHFERPRTSVLYLSLYILLSNKKEKINYYSVIFIFRWTRAHGESLPGDTYVVISKLVKCSVYIYIYVCVSMFLLNVFCSSSFVNTSTKKLTFNINVILL